MPIYSKRSAMPASQAELFAWHARPGALRRLLPPWLAVRVERTDDAVDDGARAILRQKIGPVWQRWVAEHFDCVPPERFRDRQVEGPFKAWTHTHRMIADGPASMLEDTVDYDLPAGGIGRLLLGGKVERELERMFAFRHARTRGDLVRHATFADRPRLHVAVTGASGAIASNLIPFLTTGGHCVSRFVRTDGPTPGERASARGSLDHANNPRAEARSPGDAIVWNTRTGDVDEDKLSACDAIVHLAGRNIAVRWTSARKRAFRESRVTATRKFVERLARMRTKPRVMICASAIGYYGDRGDEPLTESSPPGEGFAAEMCAAWEAAARPAREAGIRVVHLRIGIVLSANSGALPKLLTPARLGLAGPIAGGRMFVPWIAMDDLVGMIHAALMDDAWAGPVHAVTDSAPQADLIHTLGRVLRRPAFVPMPAVAVKTLFGQMGRELLLASTNARPPTIAGHRPLFPTLDAALRFELGRSTSSTGGEFVA